MAFYDITPYCRHLLMLACKDSLQRLALSVGQGEVSEY